jgi:O-antigen/teichoic acid export membrane protein
MVPIAGALAAVPFLLGVIGQERLGVLSLIWVVVGYFSFLDMGLGRAVTVAVASINLEGRARLPEELAIVGTASLILLALGTVAAVLLAAGIGLFGVPVRASSPELNNEIWWALIWMLPSLPLLLLASSLRGYLEGVAAFRTLNLLRIPTGVLLTAVPCIAALYSPVLVWACVSIFAVRLLHAVLLLMLVAQQMGMGAGLLVRGLAHRTSRARLRALMAFGGWATVSNLVGPVIVYADRFVIGMVVAAGTIAVYAVPFDAVARMPVLVASLCSVLLPELARLSSNAASEGHDRYALHQLVKKSGVLSAWVVGAMVAMGWLLTPYALQAWLGFSFAQQSTDLTRILILAFGFNSLAQVPFTALQAVGKVRTIALVHAWELLPYCILVMVAVNWFGVLGAAYAALLRSVLDFCFLAWMWQRHAVMPLVTIHP